LLQAENVLETVDRLYGEERHQEGYDYTLRMLEDPPNGIALAELYWRLSRFTKEVGDIAEREGAKSSNLAAIFEEGESYADRAIELDQESYWGYYWKSVNIARLSAVQGILKSLVLVKPMKAAVETALEINPGHSNSYYLLSIMYKSAPGWPLAFGNVDFAVSLCRKAIDLNRVDYEIGEDEINFWYHLELARHLEKRGWNERKRAKRQPEKADKYAEIEDEVERSVYYEGTIDIGMQSDKAEAIEILNWLIAECESKPNPKVAERLACDEARVLLDTLRN
jgi:tetratricopeptide (TPR) repeat protein